MAEFASRILAPFARLLHPIGLLIVLSTLAYTAAVLLVPASLVISVLDCITIAFCMTVAVIYSPNVWRILNLKEPQLAELLMVGVWLVCFDTAVIRVWRIIWTMLGNPAWLNNQTWFGYVTLMQLIGVLLIMCAPRRSNGTLFKGAQRTIITALSAAAFLVIVTYSVRYFIT